MVVRCSFYQLIHLKLPLIGSVLYCLPLYTFFEILAFTSPYGINFVSHKALAPQQIENCTKLRILSIYVFFMMHFCKNDVWKHNLA